MTTNGEKRNAKKALPLLRSFSDNYEINDVEVPGTPKTPRTSTTPGNWIRLPIMKML